MDYQWFLGLPIADSKKNNSHYKAMELQGLKEGATWVLIAFHDSDIGDESFQNQHPYSIYESC